jgi:hypothetical protein
VFHSPYEMRGLRANHEHFQARGPLTRNWYGMAQHVLLSALPRGRMSKRARERLAGWNAKFGEPHQAQAAQQEGEGSVVHSPIPREKLAQVSDREWLSIITGAWKKGARKPGLHQERNRWVERSDEEFARDFGIEARLFPRRFAALLLRVPESSPGEYLRAFLSAVAEPPPGELEAPADWGAAPVEAIEKVLKHFETRLQERHLASAVCRLVEVRAADAWSEGTIVLVRSYAEHSDPELARPAGDRGEGADAEDDYEREEDQSNLDVAALSCVRGAAAGTLRQLLFAKPELCGSCLPTVERLVADPHPAVRVAAQGLCLPLYNFDRNRAVELFVRCCEHGDDRVLAGQHANRFLRYTWHSYSAELAPVFERMVGSSYGKVAEQGAFWVTVGHIGPNLYGDLASACLRGDTARRKGAANAAAASFREPDWRQTALPMVVAFFDDEERDVVAQVVGLLREEAILASQEGPILAEAFVRSSALALNGGDLFHGMSEFGGSLVPYAPTIQEAVARLTGEFETATHDPSTRVWGAVRLLPPLLLRLYEQAEGTALKLVRDSCLDVWDRFLRGRLDLEGVLGQLDT